MPWRNGLTAKHVQQKQPDYLKTKPFSKSLKYFWKKLHEKMLASRSIRAEMFFKKSVFKNFAKFMGKDIYRPGNLLKKRLNCFLKNSAKVLRTSFLRNTSRLLLLNIAIICQEHLKPNVRRTRATIFWSFTSTFQRPKRGASQNLFKN